MDVAVPFDAVDPKTRLDQVLPDEERGAFARTLLEDVLDAVRGAGFEPTVYATAPVAAGADVVVDDSGLDALCGELFAEPPVALVMADLGLVTPDAIDRLLAAEGDVVAAPGLGGGTNAIVVRDAAFATDFHGASIRDHRAIARETGLEWAEVDSLHLGVDVDERSDLVEVLLHGEGAAADWLHDHGFRVAVRDGRATVISEE